MAINTLTDGSPVLQLPSKEIADFDTIQTHLYCFRKLLRKDNGEPINDDEVHSVIYGVAGLFLSTLQSMDNETVYDVITENDSFTIVCQLNTEMTIRHLQNRFLSMHSEIEDEKEKEVGDTNGKKAELLTQMLQSSNSDSEEESEMNDFQLVFSSEFSETSDENASEDNQVDDHPEVENLTKDVRSHSSQSTCSSNSAGSSLLAGHKQFIGSCIQRKLNLLQSMKFTSDAEEQKIMLEQSIGFEHTLAAACNFRIRYPPGKDLRVIHICFLSVRKHLRQRGIASMFINLIKNTAIVGDYDAIFVHADMEAQEFFRKHGFTDDILVNHNWEIYAGEFVNCKLMTFLPGFTSKSAHLGFAQKRQGDLVRNLDACIEKWRVKSVDAQTEQFVLYQKLRTELIQQCDSLQAKRNEIRNLLLELRNVYDDIVNKRLEQSSTERESSMRNRIAEIDKRLRELDVDHSNNIPVTWETVLQNDRGDTATFNVENCEKIEQTLTFN